jgi:two-component system chemotaxis sensor kinase CheA
MGVFTALERDFDLEIVEEFLSHYSFMTEAMEPLIIGLEKPELYTNNINELFRIFHNIKSASGYLKIEALNKLVTLGEEVLEECRKVEGIASDELVSWLLLISDQLALYKDNLEQDVDNFTPINHNIIKVPREYLKSS